MEPEVRQFSVPTDKLYAVFELTLDHSGDEEDGDSREVYACIATHRMVNNTTRSIIDDQIRYHGDVMWPKDEGELQSYLQKPNSEPPKHWVTHKEARILKFCTTLGQAKDVSSQATTKSDFTDSDFCSNRIRKRSRKPVERFHYSHNNDSDSSDSDNTGSGPKLPSLSISSAQEPIKGNGSKTYKRIKLTNLEEESPTASSSASKDGNLDGSSNHMEPNSSRSSSPRTPSSTPASTSNTEKGATLHPPSQHSADMSRVDNPKNIDCSSSNLDCNSSNLDRNSSSNRMKTSSGLPRSLFREVGLGTTLKSSSSRQSSPHSSPWKHRSSTFSPRRNSNTALGVSNRIFSREMQELRTRCDKLAIMVNKIYNCVCPVLETANENDGRGMPKLPNSSFSEIVVWEEFLKDHDNALHVVRLLTDRCSANNLRDSVNNMLRFVLSNKLACSFNLKGKNKTDATLPKVAFEGSKSFTTLLAGVTAFKKTVEKSGGSLHYSISPAEVGAAVGKWLKDAPKRYLLDLKADKAVSSATNKVPQELFLIPPEGFKIMST